MVFNVIGFRPGVMHGAARSITSDTSRADAAAAADAASATAIMKSLFLSSRTEQNELSTRINSGFITYASV